MEDGAELVVGRALEAGVGALNLAASYHSGRFFRPHAERKFHLAEEGVVYFEPHPELYRGPLKPRRSQHFKDVDVLARLLEAAKPRGVQVSSWTVTLHNQALGSAHPELAVQDLYGQRDPHNLCPSQPASKDYIRGLVQDLAAHYDLYAIMLESASYPWGAVHGDHHEMFGVALEPLTSDLLATCFCEACHSSAREKGLNLERAKAAAKRVVELSLKTPAHVLNSIPASEALRTYHLLTLDLEELRELALFKRMVVEELFQEAREALRAVNPKVRLHIIAFGGWGGGGDFGPGRGSQGEDLHRLARWVDGVDLITYVSSPELAHYLVRWVKAELGGEAELIAGLRPSHPITASEAQLVTTVREVVAAGADGVAFYNYGLTPLEHFPWIRRSLEAVGAARG